MTEEDKLLSLLSSTNGTIQFLELLKHTNEKTRHHFTSQVYWDGFPTFHKKGSIQGRIDTGDLEFEDQVILGFNQLALSDQLTDDIDV